MGRLVFLSFLGFFALGYTAKCPSQKTYPEREILCYTSSNDLKQLEDSICRCTILVQRGHDLQDLNASGVEEFRDALKKVNPAIQFVLSINDYQGSLRTSAIARQQAIARISTILNEIDGVELNVTAGTKERLVHFIHGLKEEMIRKSKERKILWALPTNDELLAKEFDIKSLAKYVDLFTISTHYLMSDEDVFKTFHPSRLMGLFDLLNTDSLVDLIHGLGVDKRKILISLPASGYKFTLRDNNNNAPSAPTVDEEPSIINRKEFCDIIQEGEWTIERDKDLTAPYAFNNFTWIAFEDKISTKIKGKYVLLRDLAGLAIDEIENDSETNCGRAITEEIYHSFTDNQRKTREAVLSSLQKDIHNTENVYPSGVKASNFRISRIVDNEGKVHAMRETTQTEFSCLKQGYFVHPKSCNRFYRCVKFNQQVEDYSVFEFDCPAGLAFDEQTEVCVWPGSLTRGSPCPGSSEIAPTTPHRFRCPGEGYYADPQNCRWFFACINLGEHDMTAYEFRCPYGLVFDEKKLICEWPWLVPNCTGVNYEHKGGYDGGMGHGDYDKSAKDGFYGSSQGDSARHDHFSKHQYATHSIISSGYITTTPENVFISTPHSQNNEYDTSTTIAEVYRGDGGKFKENQSNSENQRVDNLTPSESHIQTSHSGAIETRIDTQSEKQGFFMTGRNDGTLSDDFRNQHIAPTRYNIPQHINPSGFVDIKDTAVPHEIPKVMSGSTISIGNDYYINQAGTIGTKTRPNSYYPAVSNTFGSVAPAEQYYANQRVTSRIKTQFPSTPVTTGDGIENYAFNQNPKTWLIGNNGDDGGGSSSDGGGVGQGHTAFPNKIQLGATPALSPGQSKFQYSSPIQYGTSSYTPGLGIQKVLPTGATRGKLPVDYAVAIPEGANGNQFFTNHAAENSMYKSNPFLSSTSITSFGNNYHKNQAGNSAEVSTLLQSNDNGYKTNEYYDNGGRSTIRYNNGSIIHKYTEDDVRNRKIPISALIPSAFLNQSSRPVSGIYTREGFTKNGQTKTGITTAELGGSGSYIIGAYKPRYSITNSDEIGENAFSGSTKLGENFKTQLIHLSTTMKPKPISNYNNFDTSVYSSIKPRVEFGIDGTLANDKIETLSTHQPPFLNIHVDNNKAMVTSEPAIVNTFSSFESTAAQYSRPFSVSSTVKPIQYTKVSSSTSIPMSINTAKNHNEFSNIGVFIQGTSTPIPRKNTEKNVEYNDIDNPDYANNKFLRIPSSMTKQQNDYDKSTQINEEGYKDETFGPRIPQNKTEFIGLNRQIGASVRPEIYRFSSPTIPLATPLAPVVPIRGIPSAKSSAIPLNNVSKQLPNYNRGNSKYKPTNDYNESELSGKMEEHTITTQEPAVTTYNGGYNRDSSAIQSSKIAKIENRGKVVIKYSDLRPVLLEKLGAECTCKSDPFAGFRSNKPLLIDSSKGTIDLRNYDESDVYVDLESNKEFRENYRLTTTPSPKLFKSKKPTSFDSEISASFNINRGKSRGAKSLSANEKNQLPNAENRRQSHFPEVELLELTPEGRAECARPGLFRHPQFCNKFYICYWDQWKKKFTLNISDCPVHLTFDSNAGACNWPSRGPACQGGGHLLV